MEMAQNRLRLPIWSCLIISSCRLIHPRNSSNPKTWTPMKTSYHPIKQQIDSLMIRRTLLILPLLGLPLKSKMFKITQKLLNCLQTKWTSLPHWIRRQTTTMEMKRPSRWTWTWRTHWRMSSSLWMISLRTGGRDRRFLNWLLIILRPMAPISSQFLASKRAT